jgi:hypothetical protein
MHTKYYPVWGIISENATGLYGVGSTLLEMAPLNQIEFAIHPRANMPKACKAKRLHHSDDPQFRAF